MASSTDFQTLYFRTLVILAALATAVAVYYLRHIIFLGFLALLVAIFFTYLSGPLERKLRLPRWLAVITVLIGLAIVFGIIGFLLISPFANQMATLIEKLPTIFDNVRLQLTIWLQEIGDWAPQINPEKLAQEAAKYAGDVAARIIKVLSGGFSLLTDVVAVIVMGTFLAIERRRAFRAFSHLFRNRTPDEMRELAARGLQLLQGWMLGQLTAMVFLGIFTTVAFWIAGIDYFLIFGSMAALFSVVPYLGPFLSMLGPLVWAIFLDPTKIIWVLVIWAAAQALEGNLITPLIMHRYVQLSPLAVIVGILVMGTLFGFLGIVVAVPLTAITFLFLGEVFPWWKGKTAPAVLEAEEE